LNLDEDSIELAQKYADALERIKELHNDQAVCFSEDNVLLAERYLGILEGIKEINDEL